MRLLPCRYFVAFLLCICAGISFAQSRDSLFVAPFNFPLLLSGNFGELRSDHFHSGVDFKTQGVVGKPIRCVADGYICRAVVTPGGYGNALYVMHDNGYMTVYAHLDRFPAGVERVVRDYQYVNETFRVDLHFSPDKFRVKQGELLAYAGNSGYSFGPHLHFEVRDSSGNELYDPMQFYKDKIKDTREPIIHSLAVYPKMGKGAVFGSSSSRTYDVCGDSIKEVVEAWGMVGFGVKALDYMDGTTNKYGVRRMELLVDGELLFFSSMDNFSFDENLLINAWVDYGRLYNNGEWYQKLYIDDNNPLRLLNSGRNGGWFEVNEERDYGVECRMTDYHGNESCLRFIVRGKKSVIPPFPACTHVLYCDAANKIEYLGMELELPKGVLFENALLNVRLLEGEGLSWRYLLTDTVYPMLEGAKLSIRVGDRLPVDKSKLYVRHVEPNDSSSVGGVYWDGWITANITTLSCYEVAVDTVPPMLSPVNEEQWMDNGRIVFSVKDKETSIAGFKGTIDGDFVLFEYNYKNSLFTLDLRREKVSRGEHLLRFVVSDACGNETVFEKSINY